MGEIINFDEMENTPKEDLIAKYSGGKPYAPLQPPVPQTPPTEKVDYEGLTLHSKGRSNRFRIIDKEGTSYGCGYAYLIGWVFTPPSMLTINTSTHICTIEGRGLEEIDRALLEERVKDLRAYNPKLHTLLEDTKVVIENLDFLSRADLL